MFSNLLRAFRPTAGRPPKTPAISETTSPAEIIQRGAKAPLPFSGIGKMLRAIPAAALALSLLGVTAPLLVPTQALADPDYCFDPTYGPTLSWTVPANQTSYMTLSGSTTSGCAGGQIVIIGGPSHGSQSNDWSGFSYTPSPGYSGPDQVTYIEYNAYTGQPSTPGTVNITVTAPPAVPPTAANANMSVGYNVASVGTLPVSGNINSWAVGAATKGTIASAGWPNFTYTPNTGALGADQFHYTVCGPGGCAGGDIFVNIAPPPPPGPNAVSTSTAYNTAVSGQLTASNMYNGVSSFGKASEASHGTANVVGSGAWNYTPAPGWIGTDSFNFYANNPGGTSYATVTVTTSAPAAPVAQNSTLTVAYNTPTAGSVSATGVVTSYAMGAQPPANVGTVAFTGPGYTFTPAAGYIGSASGFTYTATGPGGTTAGQVNLTVNPPPAPTVTNKSISATYDGSGSVDLAPSGVWSGLTWVTTPTKGNLSATGSVVTYYPLPGTYGTDSWTFTASGAGGTSNVGTVTVTTALPPPPTLADDTLAAPFETAALYTPNPAGNWSGFTASAPSHGTTAKVGNTVRYTPAAGYFGPDSFTVTVSGPGGTASPATVSVTVGLPPAPVAHDWSTMTAYEVTGVTPLPADGVISSYAIASQPAHGAVSLAGDLASYTPNPGYYGPDSFTFTATGPGGTSNAARIDVTVGLPAAPTVSDTELTTPFETTGTTILPAQGVYTQLHVVTAPLHGSASITGTTLTYTPAAGFYGDDLVVYRATGPGGASADSTVVVHVGLPPAPTVAAATINTAFETPGSATLSVSGFAPVLAVSYQPANGTVGIINKTVTYTPNPGFFGPDAFRVTATNDGGTSPSALISVSVGLPPAPTIAAASITTAYQAPGSADLVVSGVYTSLQIVTSPTHGSAQLAGTRLNYTPSALYYGADQVVIKAVGPGGESTPLSVPVTVGLPGAPSGVSAAVSTPYETAKTVTLQSSGVTQSFALDSQPAHGAVTLSGAVATYTPDPSYFGPDAFTFTASGPGGTSAPATISITVGLPAAPAVTPGQVLNTPFETPGDLVLASTGVRSSFGLVAGTSHGTVTISGDVASYTPNAGYYGPDSFSVSAAGPGGTSSPVPVAVMVGLPPAPVAVDGVLSTPFESIGNVDVTATGVYSSFAIASQPSHGTATMAGSKASYTPNAGYYGPDSFTFTAIGPGGTSSPATIGVTVELPGKPVASPNSIATAYNTAGSVQLLATGVLNGLRITVPPTSGTAAINGSIATYTPNPGFFGADSFVFVADGPGGTSAPATVAVTVAVPPAPGFGFGPGGGEINTPYETPGSITIPVTGVYTSVDLAALPQTGSVVLTGLTATYTPAPGFYGEDEFTVTATGPGGTSTPATVKVKVGLPAAPTITAEDLETYFETPGSVSLKASGVYDEVEIYAVPKNGDVEIQAPAAARSMLASSATADLRAVYTPASGFFGADSFMVVAKGPGGMSAPARVSVKVTGGPPPEAADLAGTVLAGSPVIFHVTQGLANGPFTGVTITSPPAAGSARVVGLDIEYTAPADYAGDVAIGFAVANIFGQSSPAVLKVKVNPLPVAADLKAELWAGKAVSVELTQDATGGPFLGAAIVSMSPSEAGTAVITTPAAGRYVLTFTPKGQFFGKVAVRYTLSNAYATSAAANLVITVKERPDPSRDAEVTGLIDAQTQTAYRFGTAQLGNVGRRLESLHGQGTRRDAFGLSMGEVGGREWVNHFAPPELGPLGESLWKEASWNRTPVNQQMVEEKPAQAGGDGAPGRGLSWWLGGAVDLGSKQSKEDRAGFRFTTDGVSLGADVQASDKLILGAGVGYGHDTTKVGKNGTKTTTDGVSLFAYGSYQPSEHTFIDGVAGFGRMDLDAQRYLTMNGGMVTGSRVGREGFMSLKGGWEHRGLRLHLSPYGGVEAVAVRLGSFVETGDDTWALHYRAQHAQLVTAVAGIHGDYLFPLKKGDLSPTFRGEYRQDVKAGGKAGVSYADWADSPLYDVKLSPYDSKSLVLGAGLDWKAKDGGQAAFEYEATFRPGEKVGGRLSLKLSTKF